jgi:hypothetical protein
MCRRLPMSRNKAAERAYVRASLNALDTQFRLFMSDVREGYSRDNEELRQQFEKTRHAMARLHTVPHDEETSDEFTLELPQEYDAPLTPEQIRAMPLAEYASYRQRIGINKPGNGLFN